MGVDPQSVAVVSRGESEPITQNPAEYEKNRRTEIFVKE
jgi:flagellar motor protein MotB